MTKVMRHSEGQKQLFSGLKQIFSDKERNEDGFEKIEKVLEGLVTADNENKKSVLDQVTFSLSIIIIILIVMCRRCSESSPPRSCVRIRLQT